jgi:hypothetical protein
MGFLYAVFIVSIAALLWAGYAMVRTVRGHGRPSRPSALNLRGDPLDEDSALDSIPDRPSER